MTLLLDLWTIKIRQGNGRPFEASSDMYLVALDIILTAALNFPQNETMILKQIAKVESCDQPDSRPGLEDEPFSFPTAPLDPELKSFVYLTESLGVAFRSPLPRLSHWWYLQKAESKRAVQLNNRIIRRKINESIVRLEKGSVDDEAKSQLKCAVDQILWRERAAAEKRGVRPDFHRKAVYHEVSLRFFFSPFHSRRGQPCSFSQSSYSATSPAGTIPSPPRSPGGSSSWAGTRACSRACARLFARASPPPSLRAASRSQARSRVPTCLSWRP